MTSLFLFTIVIARYEAIPNIQRGYASSPVKFGIASYLTAMTGEFKISQAVRALP